VLFCVLFVCKCVLPPGDNPTAVNKYIISYLTYSIYQTERRHIPQDRKPTILQTLRSECKRIDSVLWFLFFVSNFGAEFDL